MSQLKCVLKIEISRNGKNKEKIELTVKHYMKGISNCFNSYLEYYANMELPKRPVEKTSLSEEKEI